MWLSLKNSDERYSKSIKNCILPNSLKKYLNKFKDDDMFTNTFSNYKDLLTYFNLISTTLYNIKQHTMTINFIIKYKPMRMNEPIL